MKHLLFPLFFLGVLHASTAQSVSNSNLLNQTSGLIENKGQLTDNKGTFFQDSPPGYIPFGFILKFDENGNQLWGTGIVGTTNPTGSQGDDFAYGLGINSAGEVYVSGTTSSVDFPLMDNGQYFDNSLDGTLDAFIMKFSDAGALLWSTLVGGSQHDFGRSVEIDADDNVLLIGYTKSSDMTMLNSYGGEGDHFMIKFDPAGQKLWGRHFGGSASESVSLAHSQ